MAALYLAREVLVPITVAGLLSFVLSPLVDLLRRLKFGRVPSVLIAVIIAISIIGLIGAFVGTQVAQLATRVPEYASTIEKKIDTVRDYALSKFSGVLGHVGYGKNLARPYSQPRQRCAGEGEHSNGAAITRTDFECRPSIHRSPEAPAPSTEWPRCRRVRISSACRLE